MVVPSNNWGIEEKVPFWRRVSTFLKTGKWKNRVFRAGRCYDLGTGKTVLLEDFLKDRAKFDPSPAFVVEYIEDRAAGVCGVNDNGEIK